MLVAHRMELVGSVPSLPFRRGASGKLKKHPAYPMRPQSLAQDQAGRCAVRYALCATLCAPAGLRADWAGASAVAQPPCNCACQAARPTARPAGQPSGWLAGRGTRPPTTTTTTTTSTTIGVIRTSWRGGEGSVGARARHNERALSARTLTHMLFANTLAYSGRQASLTN